MPRVESLGEFYLYLRALSPQLKFNPDALTGLVVGDNLTPARQSKPFGVCHLYLFYSDRQSPVDQMT